MKYKNNTHIFIRNWCNSSWWTWAAYHRSNL